VQIHFHSNANCVSNSIGNLIHQPFIISYTNYPSVIVLANKDYTTLCIGKTANPFQVVIVPTLFVFYVLLFGHLAFLESPISTTPREQDVIFHIFVSINH
jgi:hypothetical protein